MILVTGAGGYIGSQTCKLLKQNNHTVIANDKQRIAHTYHDGVDQNSYGNISDMMLADCDVVVHIGATSLVGPSIANPREYYQNNVGSMLDLLDKCVRLGVSKIVFASSAACYGEPEEDVCAVNNWHEPCNPYGWSKRMGELILKDYFTAYDINSVSLRFFNVAGADSDCEMGPARDGTHIISRAMESAIKGDKFTLYGTDYDTKDGTCVRDYVHVEDIAKGVLNSIELLEDNNGAFIFNLGSESGYSNREVINSINTNTPLTVDCVDGDRRKGDPGVLIADTDDAVTTLLWKPAHDLNTIIQTQYAWYTK